MYFPQVVFPFCIMNASVRFLDESEIKERKKDTSVIKVRNEATRNVHMQKMRMSLISLCSFRWFPLIPKICGQIFDISINPLSFFVSKAHRKILREMTTQSWLHGYTTVIQFHGFWTNKGPTVGLFLHYCCVEFTNIFLMTTLHFLVALGHVNYVINFCSYDENLNLSPHGLV